MLGLSLALNPGRSACRTRLASVSLMSVSGNQPLAVFASPGLCTKNTSWALIERPYSCAPQAVGAVYDRPGFLVQSPPSGRADGPRSEPDRAKPQLKRGGAGRPNPASGVGFSRVRPPPAD